MRTCKPYNTWVYLKKRMVNSGMVCFWCESNHTEWQSWTTIMTYQLVKLCMYVFTYSLSWKCDCHTASRENVFLISARRNWLPYSFVPSHYSRDKWTHESCVGALEMNQFKNQRYENEASKHPSNCLLLCSCYLVTEVNSYHSDGLWFGTKKITGAVARGALKPWFRPGNWTNCESTLKHNHLIW